MFFPAQFVITTTIHLPQAPDMLQGLFDEPTHHHLIASHQLSRMATAPAAMQPM